MRYGFYLPTRGEWAHPDALTSFAQTGDQLGFASVMIADHLVFPLRIESKYPYTVDGSFPGHGDAFDQLSLMAFIAAKTERLRIVSSVMILPHRNPLLTAKALATIDVLSKGRITVGVGVGWLREEFEALDAPDFDQRGSVSDEYIEIFKKCWSQDPVSHQGEHYAFNDLHCLPHPVQKPHPPIWIGGHSRPALRRAARYGDGWHPVGAIAAAPLPPEDMAQKIGQLKKMAQDYGRDPEAIEISYKAPIYDPGLPVPGTERKPFTGGAEEIANDIRAFKRVGIEELIFDFRAATLNESVDRMSTFAEQVMSVSS